MVAVFVAVVSFCRGCVGGGKYNPGVNHTCQLWARPVNTGDLRVRQVPDAGITAPSGNPSAIRDGFTSKTTEVYRPSISRTMLAR